MSRKTKRQHKRHHKNNRKNIKTKKHRRRRRKEIFTIPGNKGIPLFTAPDKKHPQKIMVNQPDNQSGNMIMGLRNM
jgi:hypothetical protein